MRPAILALAGILASIAAPASALTLQVPAIRAVTPVQYYYPYRRYTPHVYAQPRFYGERGVYPRRMWGTPGFLTPRYDPRNGGYYCLDVRFTVQNGVCRLYRGY